MEFKWESEDMGWAYYFYLDWESFYIAIVLAGIDIQFHIHNLRDIIYEEEDFMKRRLPNG